MVSEPNRIEKPKVLEPIGYITPPPRKNLEEP